MSYSLKNSAQSVTYTVADNTENSTSTSLTFIGKNFTGYGLALNENFVYLLENFSNTVGNYPLNPISGQLFWDSTNKYMHVYDGAAWKVIYGALASLTVNTSITTTSLNANVITGANIGNTGTILNGTISTNLQPYINSVGTLSNLQVTGTITGSSNITVQTANVYSANHIANTAMYSGSYYYSNGSPFLGGAKFTTSNTAPSGASTGDMWYQGNSDILFVYIKDASNNNYWLDTTSTPSAFANVAITNSIYPSSNASVNLGSTSGYWNNVYAVNFLGTSTTAKYADLAEKYSSDFPYEPGTVVIFGGAAEITVTDVSHSNKVAGVISTNPAYMMNGDADGLYIALQGRVPCRVKGPVSKGQMIVTSYTPGVGCGIDDEKYKPGCVVGKSLVDVSDGEIHLIEVAVGRL